VNLQILLKKTIFKAFFLLSGPAFLASLFDASLLAGIRFFVEILSETSPFTITEWTLAMILLICLRFIFLRSRVVTTQKIFRQLESGLQGYFLSILRHIQPRFFHHPESDSKVQAAFEATRTIPLSGEALMQTLQAVLQLLIFIPVLFYLSWPLSLLLFVVVMPVLAYTQNKWKTIGPIIEKQMNSEALFRSELEQIKKLYRFWSSAIEKSIETNRLIQLIRSRRTISVEAGIKQASLSFMIESVSILAMIGVLTFCGWMISKSWMEPKDLILYCSAVFLCYKPVKECIRIFPQLRAAKTAYNILSRFAEEPRQKREVKTYGSALKITSASFRYENGVKPIFNLFSTEWEINEPVLITGPNGAGKSTLLRLIAGLEEWHSGIISYPNIYNKAGIFFISQNIVLPPIYLLNHLIKQNENPYLNDFIEQANVSHLFSSNSFSGGEKARFALIWALASKSQILLLDEPFAYISRFDKDSLLNNFLNTAKVLNKWIILSSHEKMEESMLKRFQQVIIDGK
jgi:ABC-type bacteriocin/lantibiotic exporter with double-glycine peptidase domain